MAYFANSERKTEWEKMGSPSPCQYNQTLGHSRSFACAPFGSTQKLNRSVTVHRDTNPESLHRPEEDFYSISNLNLKVKP